MKIKIAIASLITLVLAVASPFEAVAFEKITNYEKLYSDSFSVSSTNISWTKLGNSAVWLGSGNIQQSWTPQITFNNNRNITVEKGDLLVFSFTTAISNQSIPDECSVGLSYWAVVDCYNEYQKVNSEQVLSLMGCSHKIQNPNGDWMCDEWTALYNTSKPAMVNKFFYTLRWQGETTAINNIRLGGVLFSKDAQNNNPVLWSVGTLSFFRGGKGLTDIYNYLEQNDVNQGQQEAGQQAQQEGQQTSDTSGTQVSQGTQSLLSAITGFVGVISNATPTNCRITGDMGALDLGELDFCQDNPPAIITTIGTLILIGITIPITIWVIKKIISMFRSFTNG